VTLDPPLPEFAFIGRSNVGKSSLINALLRRKRLARVSGTPGKTTLINVYRLPTFYLVDLPGYGFAKASKTARAGYRKLITAYLKDRADVAGLVWLLDIRRSLSERRTKSAARSANGAFPAWPRTCKPMQIRCNL